MPGRLTGTMEGTGGGGGGEGDEDDQLHWGDNVVVSVVGMCLCAAAAGVQVRSGSVTREYLLLSHHLYQLTSTSLSTEQQHFLRTGKYLRWEIFSCRRPLTLHAIPVFLCPRHIVYGDVKILVVHSDRFQQDFNGSRPIGTVRKKCESSMHWNGL